MSATNTIRYTYSGLETVQLGQSSLERLPELLQSGARRRIFVIASATLSEKTSGFAALREVLGEAWVGLFDRIPAHTPRGAVLSALERVREAGADAIVSIGGGSIIDACKVVQLAIDRDLRTEAELMEYAQQADGKRGSKAGKPEHYSEHSRIRQIAIPTTLSGAEHSNNAGVLNPERSAKEGYRAPRLYPQHIIYDPDLATLTPDWLWLSTAIRSLDHAVEGFCSADCHPYLEAHFLQAMRLLASSLPRAHAEPGDLQARSLNQQGVWLACCGLGSVRHGASHGIGYVLGSLCGIPHGYTSCIMLPAVLAWNESVLGERADIIAGAMGQAKGSAAEAVRQFIAGLGLPTTLSGLGVERSQLQEIAARACEHPVVRNNPRPIRSRQEVEEILALAF